MTDENEMADIPDPPWLTQMTGIDFEYLIRSDSVIETCVGLHQLAVIVERSVNEHDRLTAAEIADQSRVAQQLTQDTREDITERLSTFLGAYRQRVRDRLDQLDVEAATQLTDPLQWIIAQSTAFTNQNAKAAATALSDIPTDNIALVSFLAQYSQAAERRPLLPLIRRALLITAVATIETMILGVIERVQYDHGGADHWGPRWPTPDRLSEVVRKLTRGSIEDWEPRLHTELGIELPAATCDWPAVKEIWARRNVLVHAAGIADDKYAARVAEGVPGTRLEVDSKYLTESIDLLCGFALGVILLVWTNAHPEHRMFLTQLALFHTITAESEHRWPLAENLYAISAYIDDDPDQAAASKVNSWLARTRWRDSDSIVDEVRAWPVDNLPPIFTVAKMILLQQFQEAMEIIPSLIDRGELTIDQLQSWPLFEPLRDEPEFQRLIAD